MAQVQCPSCKFYKVISERKSVVSGGEGSKGWTRRGCINVALVVGNCAAIIAGFVLLGTPGAESGQLILGGILLSGVVISIVAMSWYGKRHPPQNPVQVSYYWNHECELCGYRWTSD